VSDEARLEEEMTRFFQLHAMRWRTRWQPGVLFGRAVQAFHRQAARDLRADGTLRLHALKLDGKTVASLYCFTYNETGSYYLSGFDPALSKNSVGTLLTAKAMETALLEGCREFDFLRGMEPYKYRWGCVNRENYRILLPGGGPLAPAAKRALFWEQRIADRYEAKAHGGEAHGKEAKE
jgi:CelD/BcsL family acetyltransferase involved in cellulose biosynthesis